MIPPVPVRQWVISIPKRLRCFLEDRPAAVSVLNRHERVRKRLVRWFKSRGFLDADSAADMLAWEHSVFSIDAIRAHRDYRSQCAELLPDPQNTSCAPVSDRPSHAYRLSVIRN